MTKRIYGKDKEYIEKEDWKINAWDPDGNQTIKDGKPTKYFKNTSKNSKHPS